MAYVAPVGEDLPDADDVNEVGVRTDFPFSPSSFSARNCLLLRASQPSCPRLLSSALATCRDSRRDKVSLRKRYGCHPGIARVSPGAPPGVPPRSLGAPPWVSPGVPPNVQRCAAQSATSCKPAYHPRHYRLLTRVSLGTPRFVARNTTGRWLECWRVARVIVHARSLSDDVVAIDVIAVVVAP